MPGPKPLHPATRRESWPPMQARLQPSLEIEDQGISDGLDLSFIDDDPLNYFLTPAPSLSDDDDEDVDMLDAGIDDGAHSQNIVRSVSPSSLDGGRLPPRTPTPPAGGLSPAWPPTPNSDVDMIPARDDEDGEGYLSLSLGNYATTHAYSIPFSLKDFATARKARRENGAVASHAGLLSPPPTPSLHVPFPASTRGRPAHRPGPRPLGGVARRSLSWGPGRQRRLSPHAWREPSPDVWSIAEEVDEDMGEGLVASGAIPMVKPKKKVRFLLPAQEVGDHGAYAN